MTGLPRKIQVMIPGDRKDAGQVQATDVPSKEVKVKKQSQIFQGSGTLLE